MSGMGISVFAVLRKENCSHTKDYFYEEKIEAWVHGRREPRKRTYYQLSSASSSAFAAPLVLFLPPAELEDLRARAVKVEWSHEWLVPGGCALGAAVEAALRCAALSLEGFNPYSCELILIA